MITEPTLDELEQIRKDLYSAESTDENLKKIRAVEAQNERLKKAQAERGEQLGSEV